MNSDLVYIESRGLKLVVDVSDRKTISGHLYIRCEIEDKILPFKKRRKSRVSPNSRKFKRWTREEDDKLLTMHALGKSYKNISRTLNRTLRSIWIRHARIQRKISSKVDKLMLSTRVGTTTS